MGAKSPNWTDGRNLARHTTDEGSSDAEVAHSRQYVYDPGSLTWVRMTQPAAGAGGGAVTVADGADVAQGTTTDADTANTVIGRLKKLITTITDGTQRGSMKLLDSAGTNAAAVSAAGRLAVDASGVAVPVTDNAGSLTVDAPVGTPLFARLSDGAAALIGQKAMASSLPVAVASDQSDLGVKQATAASLNATAVQGNAGSNAQAWWARIGDATNGPAAVKASGTAPASTDAALAVTLRQTPSEGTALSSGSHAVGTFTFDIADTTGYTGICIITDLTVLGTSSTVTNTIQVKDPVTAKFTPATAAAFTVINSVSTTRQAVTPANAGASGNLQGGVLTKAIRVSSVVAVAASTYSIGYSLTL